MLRRAVQLAASDSVGPLGSESLAGSFPGGEMESSVGGGAQRGALLSFNFDRVSIVKELRREGIIY